MEEEDESKCECPEGIPAWVMTFADLMSLLMCFFVLLLSFAEMDIQKFKQVKGSLTQAFGVQRDVSASETPMGTSLIAQEFSSAAPKPTPLNEVRQQTTDDTKQTLEFTDALEKSENVDENENEKEKDHDNEQQQEEVSEDTQEDALRLKDSLSEEIDKGLVEIETQQGAIMIRISEKASFPSGTSTIRNSFIPVLKKLQAALNEVDGRVVVAGHTDDRPIRTSRFRSNWELSASRAVSVVHQLLDEEILPKERFIVEGHGSAHPLVDNDTRENRAKNRRVELTILQKNENNVDQEMNIIETDDESGETEVIDPLEELASL